MNYVCCPDVRVSMLCCACVACAGGHQILSGLYRELSSSILCRASRQCTLGASLVSCRLWLSDLLSDSRHCGHIPSKRSVLTLVRHPSAPWPRSVQSTDLTLDAPRTAEPTSSLRWPAPWNATSPRWRHGSFAERLHDFPRGNHRSHPPAVACRF